MAGVGAVVVGASVTDLGVVVGSPMVRGPWVVLNIPKALKASAISALQ